MGTNPPRSAVAAMAAGFIPLRLVALELLLGELAKGVHEQKPNWSPRIWEYLQNCDPKVNVAAPWCAALQQFGTDAAAKLHGVKNPLDEVALEAYVPSYVEWARKNRSVRIMTAATALPGDLVAFNFGGKRFDHIAMLELPIEGGIVSTVDGNTSDGKPSPTDPHGREGDTIGRKHRTYRAASTVLIRWDEGIVVPKVRSAIAA